MAQLPLSGITMKVIRQDWSISFHTADVNSVLARVTTFAMDVCLCWQPTFINRLTPRNKVLPEKLTGSQLVKKFPAFYGTRKFITEFTRPRHLPLF